MIPQHGMYLATYTVQRENRGVPFATVGVGVVVVRDVGGVQRDVPKTLKPMFRRFGLSRRPTAAPAPFPFHLVFYHYLFCTCIWTIFFAQAQPSVQRRQLQVIPSAVYNNTCKATRARARAGGGEKTGKRPPPPPPFVDCQPQRTAPPGRDFGDASIDRTATRMGTYLHTTITRDRCRDRPTEATFHPRPTITSCPRVDPGRSVVGPRSPLRNKGRIRRCHARRRPSAHTFIVTAAAVRFQRPSFPVREYRVSRKLRGFFFLLFRKFSSSHFSAVPLLATSNASQVGFAQRVSIEIRQSVIKKHSIGTACADCSIRRLGRDESPIIRRQFLDW